MFATKEVMSITDKIRATVDCEKIYLFGSYAYGIPDKGSDCDFYVVIPDGTLEPLDAMIRISRALAKTDIEMPIDVLAAPLSRFKALSDQPTLEQKIMREEVLLYERR